MSPWVGAALVYGYIAGVFIYSAISKRRHRIADEARAERFIARSMPNPTSVTVEQATQVGVLAASTPGMARLRRSVVWPLHLRRLLADDPMSRKARIVEETTARMRARHDLIGSGTATSSGIGERRVA